MNRKEISGKGHTYVITRRLIQRKTQTVLRVRVSAYKGFIYKGSEPAWTDHRDYVSVAEGDTMFARQIAHVERFMRTEGGDLPNLGGELHTNGATTKVGNASPNSGQQGEADNMSTFVQIGAGKTGHLLAEDMSKTLCGKDATKAKAIEGEPAAVCKACEAVRTKNEETVTVTETATAEKTAKPTTAEKREIVAKLTEAVRALAEAGEDAEGAEALRKEADTVIASLPAGERNALRANLTGALKGEPAPKAEAESAPKAEVVNLETVDYKTAEGLTELVDMGAERIREGVAAHTKASQTARSVAEVILDMRLRLKNKSGLPDLKAQTQAAKLAASDMYKAAGSKLDGTDDEVRAAVAAMVKATQYQMSDVLVSYVRALDASPEEYAEHFGKVKEAHPDAKPSDAVFEFYKLSPKSALEREKERQQEKGKLAAEAKLAIEAGGGAVAEPEGGNGEAIRTTGQQVEDAAPEKKAEVFVAGLAKLINKFDVSYLETIEDEDEKSKLEGEIKDLEDKLKELRKALI
jgi:hypothetical protein